jgi:hypothetical protein
MAVRRQLYEDFEFYSANALKIRTKDKGVQPFCFNEAQRRLHEVAERQRKTLGRDARRSW